MIDLNGVLGLTWDPQIRGASILIVAILILPGSIYLLLATNLGARIGFLVAMAGLTGWMAIMGVIWMVYGQGLKGREPSWKAKEVITGDISASTVEAVRGFPDSNGWSQLPATSPELADAQAAVDKLLVKASGPVRHGQPGPDPLQSKFPPIFTSTEEYVRVAGYRKGGDNELFTIGNHKVFFRHSPHWDVIQVQRVLDQPDLGGTPAPPVADVREPVISVVMVRDLGSVRFPPFVITVSSLIIFAIVCYVLHQRDKEIWAKKAAEEGGGERAPERVPEPAGV